MKIDTDSSFLKGSDCENGDLVTFKNEGVLVEKDYDNKKKKAYDFLVEHKGNDKTYTPNNYAVTKFKEAWGGDSIEWINKTFKVNILTMLIAGNKRQVIEPIITPEPTTTTTTIPDIPPSP